MSDDDYPNLRDIQAYLERLIERDEDKRQRYLAWLGSWVTAIAILIWLALDILQQTPGILNLAAGLALFSLVLIMMNATNSLLPRGLSGVVQKAAAPWEQSPTQLDTIAWMLGNLPKARQQVTRSQSLLVVSNLPLGLVAIDAWGTAAGVVALTLATVRIVVSLAILALMLAIAHENVLNSYMKSIQDAVAQLQNSKRWLLFFYKVGQVGKGAWTALKLAYYGVLVVATSWVVAQFGPAWPALRLAVLSFAVGILASFAWATWKQILQLGEEYRILGSIRAKIFMGELKDFAAVKAEAERQGREVSRRRASPYPLLSEE